jgi:hypothetical protein
MCFRGTVLFLSLVTTALAQDSAIRLPENFLQFDVTKLYQAVREAPRVRLAALKHEVVRPEVRGPETCGYIRVSPADPAVDPGIMLPFRYYVQGKMRRIPGLAPCNPAEN